MAFRRDKTVERGASAASGVDGTAVVDEIDAEIVIDAEVADPTGPSAPHPVPRSSALPEAREIRAVEARRESEVAIRNVAVATAGGIAAGAATVVLAKTVSKLAKPVPGLARRRRSDIVASRSFMVDVHMLKSQR